MDALAAGDADLIARLAAGEHLGERHEAELARIAASPALSSLLRLALASQGAAEELAAGIAALNAPRVVPFAARPRRRVLPWVAMAATVAGVALLATSLDRADAPSGEPAVAQQATDDAIFGEAFEGAIADAGESDSGDSIFSGEFDS
jgi:hypothetical protein